MLGTINLADVTNEKGIHMVYYGTGCIFHYDEEFKVNTGKVRPQLPGSVYPEHYIAYVFQMQQRQQCLLKHYVYHLCVTGKSQW